jgi:hypothetical protein
MPPQQPNGLLDFIDDRLDFGAHGAIAPLRVADVAINAVLRNAVRGPRDVALPGAPSAVMLRVV